MAKSSARRIAVVCAVAAAIAAPMAQQGLHIGLDQAEFASQGDSTLRASGYAFSIWGLIYLGLAAYAVFQFRARDTALIRALGWPSVISNILPKRLFASWSCPRHTCMCEAYSRASQSSPFTLSAHSNCPSALANIARSPRLACFACAASVTNIAPLRR